jgi:predicted transcriptional regulator
MEGNQNHKFSMMSLEELYQRIEAAKYNTKQFYAQYFPLMGVFDTNSEDYKYLQILIRVAKKCLEKQGIEEFDLDKIPKKLRNLIITRYHRALNRKINRFDSTKQLFLMIDLFVPKKKVDESKIEKVHLEEVIKEWLKKVSVLRIVVEGDLGTGKTDFSLKLAEVMLRNGIVDYVIGNIQLLDNGENYYLFVHKVKKILKLSELLEFIIEHRHEPKVLVLDEGAVHLLHRRSSSAKNVIFSKLLVLFRKLKTHLILTIQDKQLLDKILREFQNNIYIRKLSKTEAEVLDQLTSSKYQLVGIKRTSIPFDTDYLAPFQIDIEEDVLDEVLMLLDNNASVEDLKRLLRHASERTEGLSRTEIALYEFVLEQREFTRKDVMAALGIEKTRAAELIRELRDEGIVEMRGRGNKISYRLTKEGKKILEKRLSWLRSDVNSEKEVF